MTSLEQHADKLLVIYCEHFARNWGEGELHEVFQKVLDAEVRNSVIDYQQALRDLYDEDLHIGDGRGFAMLRFFIWQRTTDKRLKATLALKLAQSGFATKYIKETVLGVSDGDD